MATGTTGITSACTCSVDGVSGDVDTRYYSFRRSRCHRFQEFTSKRVVACLCGVQASNPPAQLVYLFSLGSDTAVAVVLLHGVLNYSTLPTLPWEKTVSQEAQPDTSGDTLNSRAVKLLYCKRSVDCILIPPRTDHRSSLHEDISGQMYSRSV